MPYGLNKNAPRLLGTVKNRPHATQDDHDDPIRTSQPDQDDLNRSPIGSSDEEEAEALAKIDIPSSFKSIPSAPAQPRAIKKPTTFKSAAPLNPPTRQSSRNTQKETAERSITVEKSSVQRDESRPSGRDFMSTENVLFGDSRGGKKKKPTKSYTSKANLHVPPLQNKGQAKKDSKSGELTSESLNESELILRSSQFQNSTTPWLKITDEFSIVPSFAVTKSPI
jgi:hypothetical protein